MDEALISETLEALSDAAVARATRREVKPLRGVRGTPMREVARIATALAEDGPPDLEADEGALNQLFSTAWEDGLVAIGLVASALPEAPAKALAIAEAWLERVDDTQTADALGWMLIGPACLATSPDSSALLNLAYDSRQQPPLVRRALLMAGMALTPAPIEGVAAAPLRARLGEQRVRWVEAAHNPGLQALCTHFFRDEDPAVRKALRRVLKTWGETEPDLVQAFLDGAKGGVPRALREDIEPQLKRARKRLAREAAAEAADQSDAGDEAE